MATSTGGMVSPKGKKLRELRAKVCDSVQRLPTVTVSPYLILASLAVCGSRRDARSWPGELITNVGG